MEIPTSIKPQPKTDEFHNATICNKCGGTGFYCQGVENGHPISRTGFTCFNCNGSGWKISWKRGAKKLFWANVKPIQIIRDENENVIEAINPNAKDTSNA